MNPLRPSWAVKTIVVVIFLLILFRCVSAVNHTVGGTNGWDLASDFQDWSSTETFYVGDNLVFVYNPTHDVLEVNRDAYEICRISNPIKSYNDGTTVVPLGASGIRYFLCGTRGHCQTGMKVQVDVLPRSQTVVGDNTTRSGSRPRHPFDPPHRHRPPPHGHHPAPPEDDRPTVEIGEPPVAGSGLTSTVGFSHVSVMVFLLLVLI